MLIAAHAVRMFTAEYRLGSRFQEISSRPPADPPPPKKGTLFYRTRHHRHYGKPRLDNQFKVATTSIIEEVGHVLNHVGFCLLSYDVISCGLKIFKSLTNPHIL